jgi:hypothetical protein
MLRNPKTSPRVRPPLVRINSSQRPSKGGSTKRSCCGCKSVFGLIVLLAGSLLFLFLPPGPLDLGNLSSSLELLEMTLTSSDENQLHAPVIETPVTTMYLTALDDDNDNDSTTPRKETASTIPDDNHHADGNCPFRNSPLYRKVYVYPTFGEVDNGWSGSILSDAGRNLSTLSPWPWLKWERDSKRNATSHYDIDGQHVQYATELLVRDIITHPDSCLRTNNPEEATLFYVPYLPSVEHHQGSKRINDMSPSKYGQAIMDILESNKYQAWEDHFGLTSEYWKRRNGADHILVFSEPMHGLWHPRSRRGNYHFVNSQKQLTPPVVISVELSTTFVEMYPKCAAKNILVPYPNTDGRWFNGVFDSEAADLLKEANLTVSNSEAALPAEKELAVSSDPSAARPIAQFYAAGNHGTCRALRRSMQSDYKQCSASARVLLSKLSKNEEHGMRQSTFSPCPGGDSPSAKRMFDALLAGSIPVILSYDFVWPYTKEFDPLTPLDPNDFSVKLLTADYEVSKLDEKTCLPKNETQPGLQAWMDTISVEEIQRLRKGVEKARDLYGYYKRRSDLPDNPLREGALPDGGASHALVDALADRAAGSRWPACEEELKLPRGEDAKKFKC